MPSLNLGAVPAGVTGKHIDTVLDELLKDRNGKDITLPEKLLGARVVAEMVADGVHAVALDRITSVVLMRIAYGEDAAQAFAMQAIRPAGGPEPAQDARRRKAAATSAPRAMKPPAKKAPAKKASPRPRSSGT